MGSIRLKSHSDKLFSKVSPIGCPLLSHDGLWFYASYYIIPDWLTPNLRELPRWVTCSSTIDKKIVNSFVGGDT